MGEGKGRVGEKVAAWWEGNEEGLERFLSEFVNWKSKSCRNSLKIFKGLD